MAEHLVDLEKSLEADCLCYSGPIAFGADDDIREAIEEIGNKKQKLVFTLETNGGFAETARRIADTLRHHYQEGDFLVPSYAMSAGTILVMPGDAIYMDKLDVDALLKINPHLDADKIAQRRKNRQRKNASGRGGTKPEVPRVPFSDRRDLGKDAWNTTDPSARPHYRSG